MAARVGLPPWLPTAGFMGVAAILGGVAGVDPQIAIGVSIGLAFSLLTLANLTAGVIAFAFLAFLEFLFPGGYLVSMTKIAGGVLALSWVAKVASARKRDDFLAAFPGATYLLIAFLAWGVVSVTWSESPSETLLVASRYLLVFGLLVITYSAVRRRGHALWLIGAFLASTVLTAAFGLINRPSAEATELVRIDSTVGNANVLAMVLVAGIALAVGAAIASRRSPEIRTAALGVAGLCLISLIFTGSRSGIISLAVVLITSVLFAGRWRAQALGGTVAIATISVVLFVLLAPPEIRERIAQTTPGQASAATEGRVTLWQVAGRMVEDRPLIGVGLGSFQAASADYVLEPGTLGRTDQIIDDPKVAHNVYLQSLAETGIVGALLLLGVFGFPLVCALAAARNFERGDDREMEIMARALSVALVSMLAANFFASEPLNKPLWLLMGLGTAMLTISRSVLADDRRN